MHGFLFDVTHGSEDFKHEKVGLDSGYGQVLSGFLD
jgi:hypothetical protein